jgi:hypothetical protein
MLPMPQCPTRLSTKALSVATRGRTKRSSCRANRQEKRMKVTMLKMLKTFRISTTKMTTDLSSSNERGQSTTRVIRILRITGIATARITGAVRIDELTVQRNRTCPLQEQLSMVITSRTVFRGTEDDQQDQRRLLSIARKRAAGDGPSLH